MSNMTLGSLFDGSGGFPLGGMLAGITPVWASEIEPFPIRVTTKRLPFMKHYGNVSEMDGGKVEPVDIITFGSPCQDMSVAGKRAGLEGSRSNLFYEAVRIIKEMRKATGGEYPKWACWENVPGAFSSSGGEDFRCVLESLCGVIDESVSIPKPKKWANAGEILGDGYSLAWRVLDAQYWGVPQRRKRIYLVADFAGQRAGKVLFESEGLSGYTPQGFHSWQGSPGAAEEGTHPAGVGTDGYNGAIADVAATLGVNCGMSTGRNGVMVLNDQGGMAVVARGPGAVAHPIYSMSKTSCHTQAEEDIVNTLVATDYKDPPTVMEEPYCIVRRLTPTECARLQGFPDWWCSALGTDEPSEEDIAFWRDVFETHRAVTGSASKPKTDAQLVKWLKNPHTDSAEYKLWGNGVALPCVYFVLSGIVYFHQLNAE